MPIVNVLTSLASKVILVALLDSPKSETLQSVNVADIVFEPSLPEIIEFLCDPVTVSFPLPNSITQPVVFPKVVIVSSPSSVKILL